MGSIGTATIGTMFFGISLLVGVCLALVAWRMLRDGSRALLLTHVVGLVPPLCAVYMVACVVMFPVKWVFGDIAEPLPHGYTLQALGRAPGYGTIEVEPGDSRPRPKMLGWIGEVDLESDTLFGKYSNAFDAETGTLKGCCFAFNTATGVLKNFAIPREMNSFAGKPIATEEVHTYRSPDPAHVRTMLVQRWIFWAPPVVVMLGLLGTLAWWRFSTPYFY